jgi:hypothetical protein
VFYDLHAKREEFGLHDKNEIAIVRLEQVRHSACGVDEGLDAGAAICGQSTVCAP